LPLTKAHMFAADRETPRSVDGRTDQLDAFEAVT
jgi:hypothetical protein